MRREAALNADGARRLLAALWILDGLLQLLPRMFTMAMVSAVLRPPVLGEPVWLAHLTEAILQAGSAHLALFNLSLAALQVGLGLALLGPGRSRTWPHVASLLWCAAVWVFGEAFGGLLSGQASLWTGAPGSVALYALLTWAAWPGAGPEAAARRRAGVRTALGAVWALGALLQASPVFFTPTGLAELLLGNVNVYQPAWLNAWMRWGAERLSAEPRLVNALLVALMALIAAGIWWGGRARRAVLGASVALAAVFWVFGQAFGMLLMAMTTDPNAAPLLGALAVYAWPAGEAGRGAPARALRRRTAAPPAPGAGAAGGRRGTGWAVRAARAGIAPGSLPDGGA